MQDELATEFSTLPITMYAINEEGYESGNDSIVAVGDLAVLQDTVDIDVWGAWGASWRDVVVLDADNVAVYTFNLTEYDLGNEADYDHLKAVFVAVAEGAEIPSGP